MQSSRRSRSVWIPAVGLVLVAFAVSAALLVTDTPRSEATTAAHADESAPAATSGSASAVGESKGASPSEEVRAGSSSSAAGADEQAAKGEVDVSLEGVPEGAAVYVDGQKYEGSSVTLPRADRVHLITVRRGDDRTWSVSHRATEGGQYEVRWDDGSREVGPPSSQDGPRRRERTRGRAAAGGRQEQDEDVAASRRPQDRTPSEAADPEPTPDDSKSLKDEAFRDPGF